MVTTSCDLDPLFVRGLKLLQSRSKESKDQLKQLYDEVAAQRRAELAAKRGDGEESQDSRSSGSGTSAVKRESPEISKKRELEKLKQDLAELSQEIPSKKLKLECAASVSASSSPRSMDRDRTSASDKVSSSRAQELGKEKPRERLREIEEDIFFGPSVTTLTTSRTKDRERVEREERDRLAAVAARQKEAKKEIPVVQVSTVDDSDSDTEMSDDTVTEDNTGQDDSNVDEMQFELDLCNLSCVICNTITVTSTNRLLECQECHSLYHQDCHKPPVTDNVNDPRFVWYCYKCTKNLKKIVVKSQKKPTTKPTQLPSARDSPVSRPVKTEPQLPVLQPFKRLETVKPNITKDLPSGTSSTSAVPTSRGLVGLASLAANLNSRTSTNTAGGSSSSTAVSLDPAKPKSTTDHQPSRPTAAAASAKVESSKSLVSVPSDSKLGAVPQSWGSGVDKQSSVRLSPLSKSDGPLKMSKASQLTTAVVATGSTVPPVKVSAATTVGSSMSGTGVITGGSSGGGGNGGGGNGNVTGSKMSQSHLMSADKRLQIMKKKAAAKMVEKRLR